jgi:Xaa-Pro aminopeptidase
VERFRSLKALFPRAQLVPTASIVERLTSIKDKYELDAIRRAVKVSDRVFGAIIQMLRPGLTELDVAAEIAYLHRRYGAEGDAFDPIVASGRRAALPHARASAKRIRRGELVLLDFGCRVAGYHSDLSRTVAVGKPSARLSSMYKVVLDAQTQAIGAVRSGVAAADVDAIARLRIRKQGYGRYFCHSLGHGLGLQVHESPRLSSLSGDVLQRGNVVTIEPGVYVPGSGGVRIEDDVVVQEDHATILNKSPRELLVL